MECPSVPYKPPDDSWNGTVVVRPTICNIDDADLISAFCIDATCEPWFRTLTSEVRIEVMFVFRAFLRQYLSADQGQRMLCVLLNASEARDAFQLAGRMTLEHPDNLLRERVKLFTRQWSQIEDYALLVCVCKGQMKTFHDATQRDSKATTRRLDHWRKRLRDLMMTIPPEVIVCDRSSSDEDEAETETQNEDAETETTNEDTETGTEQPYSYQPATIGTKNMEAARYGRQIHAMQRDRRKSSMALCRMAKAIHSRDRQLNEREVKETIDNMERMYLGQQPLKLPPALELCTAVVDIAAEQGTGRRYPKNVRSFWMRVFSCSPQCFRTVSQMFGGPALSTIHSWMKQTKSTLRSEMLDLTKVAVIAKRWVEKYRGKEMQYTLSYDACKLDEDIVINEKGEVKGVLREFRLQHEPRQYRDDPSLFQSLWNQQIAEKNMITHAFVFVLNPISTDRGYPIHVVFANTGCATDQVLFCIQRIPEILAEAGIRVVFEASDSDTKYRMYFNRQFYWMFAQYSNIYICNSATGTMNGLTSLNVPRINRCNDIPHILKRWRSRLINNTDLFLRPPDQTCVPETRRAVNVEGLRALNPEIPTSAFRSGSLPAMDDAYPAMIFTKDTLMKAFNADRFDYIVYLLPAVCANVVFRCKTITRQRRIELAFLGWTVCIYYYSYIDSLVVKFEHSILTKELLVDLSNALFCHIFGLHTIVNEYRMSKISSMVSEHLFARLRRSMGPDQSSENFLSVLLRLVIADSEAPDSEEETIPRRSFDAATCEQGTSILPQESALAVRDFCATIFRQAGVLLPFSAPHQWVFAQGNTIDLRECLVMSWLAELANKQKQQEKFTIHAGQSRLPRIYGRSIKSRFVTAANVEPRNH